MTSDRPARGRRLGSVKPAVGRLLARRWPVALPVTAAVTRRSGLPLLHGVAFHLAEGLDPQARYQVARLRCGPRMLVDLKDHVQHSIYFIGEWEPSTTALIRRAARPGWSFLDVGANAGYFSLLAAQAGGPTSRVVAVEPNPPIGALLAVNVAMNGLEGTIAVRHEACGAAPGSADLHVSGSENSGRSTLRSGRLDVERSVVAVPVTTVDGLCAELDVWPDFVKVDAEGWEPEIARGMTTLLDEHPPRVVVLEVSPFDGAGQPQLVADLMAASGYRPHRIDGEGYLSEADPSSVRGLENLAFLRGDGPGDLAALRRPP